MLLTWLDMAARHPEELVRLVSSGTLPLNQLTFAAEAVGVLDAPLAVPALLPLLGHADAVVREGVCYGLAKHAGIAAVQVALRAALAGETSDAVRMELRSLLEES